MNECRPPINAAQNYFLKLINAVAFNSKIVDKSMYVFASMKTVVYFLHSFEVYFYRHNLKTTSEKMLSVHFP